MLREPGQGLTTKTVSDPLPGPGQAVVAVDFCGVRFRDAAVCNGTLRAGVVPSLVPGHEVAGQVAAAGAGGRGLRSEDRVATTQRSHGCGACRYCRSAQEPRSAEAAFLDGADCVFAVPDGSDARGQRRLRRATRPPDAGLRAMRAFIEQPAAERRACLRLIAHGAIPVAMDQALPLRRATAALTRVAFAAPLGRLTRASAQ